MRTGLCGPNEVCRQVGLSPRQLEYWVLIGVVTPVSERHGVKLFRRFTDHDVRILKRVKALTDEGFLVSRAAEKVRQEAA
ncbi:MAG: MerR family transcriptional regulator [Nitrospirota bacterium]